MKRILITLLAITGIAPVFSQTTKPTGKIVLTSGQKIIVENTVSIEASLSPGMDLTSNSIGTDILEVKNGTDKNYTITSTLTKLKVNMNMMGQANNYDSEEKKEPSSDIEKALAEKLNKPVDVLIDNTSGMAITTQDNQNKKSPEKENPVEGMFGMFADNSDEAVVSGAFELLPQGRSIGDNWSDSSISKDIRTVRTYTLRSITGNEAVIQLDAVSTATNKIDLQGMEMEFKSNTKTTGEIITDINTGLVKKKTTQSNITGSFQLMGQDVPISAKANTTSIYK